MKQLQSYAQSAEQARYRRRVTTQMEDSELDLLGAITLIATVVEDRAGKWPPPEDSLLAQCLIMAGATRQEISESVLRDFRQLYLRRQLPVAMSRDAAMVLYAAHRSAMIGSSDRFAFAAAVRIVGRISRRRR